MLQIHHKLFIHSPIGGHLDCFLFKEIMNKVAKNVLHKFSVVTYSDSSWIYIYLEMEFLGHTIGICINSLERVKFFTKVALVPFVRPSPPYPHLQWDDQSY